jgi:Gpi18-like mannosyltransferase
VGNLDGCICFWLDFLYNTALYIGDFDCNKESCKCFADVFPISLVLSVSSNTINQEKHMHYFQKKLISKERAHKIYHYLLLATLIFLALYIRKSVISYRSLDFFRFLLPWYTFMKEHGGFLALRYKFADYNVPYLYFVAILTYLPVPILGGLKIISIIFDFVLAFFVHQIVKLKYRSGMLPLLAAFVVLFTPTVILNSSLWAQCDSIYAAFAVGGIYFLMRRYYLRAFIFFGLSIAFKQQAIFVFPLLFVILIKQEVRLRYVFIIPCVYLLMAAPAALVGHSIRDLLTVYINQVNNYADLVYEAPSVYQWLDKPGQYASLLYQAGVLFTGSLVLMVSFLIFHSWKKIDAYFTLRLGFFFSLLVPFFLPGMHERYFYIGDILSIAYAFCIPKRAYIAIIVQFCSFCSYLFFLFGIRAFEGRYLALVMFVAILITAWDIYNDLSRAEHDGISGDAGPLVLEHSEEDDVPSERETRVLVPHETL